MILQSKPDLCCFNTRSPLAAGVTFLVGAFEGGGGPRDIITGLLPSTLGANTPVSWQRNGRSRFAPANTSRGSGNTDQCWVFPNAPGFSLSSNFTFLAYAYQSSFANGTNTLAEAATNFKFWYNNFQGEGNNWFSAGYWDNGGVIQRIGCSVPSTGVWRTYAFTVANNAPSAIYFDGISQSTSGGTGSGTRSTTGAMGFGAQAANQACNWGDKIELMVMWNRVLRPAELLSMSRDPYQLFTTPRVWVGAPLSASAFQAAWARASNRLIGGGVYV